LTTTLEAVLAGYYVSENTPIEQQQLSMKSMQVNFT